MNYDKITLFQLDVENIFKERKNHGKQLSRKPNPLSTLTCRSAQNQQRTFEVHFVVNCYFWYLFNCCLFFNLK